MKKSLKAVCFEGFAVLSIGLSENLDAVRFGERNAVAFEPVSYTHLRAHETS